MLKQIHCDKFRSTPVNLHSGFNVVSGDRVATNSIGKSTFLMVVDFAMGGNTFLERNRDVVDELGHHSYLFTFEFEGIDYYFRRDTANKESVLVCDEEWNVSEALTIGDYCLFLSQHYRVSSLNLTFRQLASLFARVWGKENLDTDRPIDAHPKQRASEAITFILKLFNRYEVLVALDEELKKAKSEKDALRDAFKENIVPKIGKKQYKDNELLVRQSGDELDDIKTNLAKYATNIREITNREITEIKTQKDSLLKEKARIDSRLRRLQTSLNESRYIKTKRFEVLKEYFPEMDSGRIAQVEEFHSDIARILKRQILTSEKDLRDENERIEGVLAELNERLSTLLKNVENPTIIVDRVFELSNRKGKAEQENSYYDKSRALGVSVTELRSSLEEAKQKQLAMISASINDALHLASEEIYGSGRKSPYLTFTKTNYRYKIFEDTGTGKAFSNLIMFDWALFTLTSIPFLIHDSLLFKNIENEAVAKMIEKYSKFTRQTFVAIDETEKYGDMAKSIIDKHTVVSLSDSSVLYIKDWRK